VLIRRRIDSVGLEGPAAPKPAAPAPVVARPTTDDMSAS